MQTHAKYAATILARLHSCIYVGPYIIGNDKMADELDLLRTVSRLARELSASFDVHLRDMNLTSARARVLYFLLPLETGASQADVTNHLGVEHPTAVRILDGIETLGYIQRVPSPDDRRAKKIVLTTAGKAIAEKVSRLLIALNAQLIADVDAADLDVANRVLLQILARTQALRSATPGQVSPQGLS